MLLGHEGELKHHEIQLLDGHRHGSWSAGWPHISADQQSAFVTITAAPSSAILDPNSISATHLPGAGVREKFTIISGMRYITMSYFYLHMEPVHPVYIFDCTRLPARQIAPVTHVTRKTRCDTKSSACLLVGAYRIHTLAPESLRATLRFHERFLSCTTSTLVSTCHGRRFA
jgi:hypothetical protein